MVRNYHVNKITKGDGFAEKPSLIWTKRPYQIALLVAALSSIVLGVLGENLMLVMAPILIVWFVPILLPTDPLDLFRWIIGRKPRAFEEIETIHERIGAAYNKAEWQIRQMQEMDISEREEQALYELAIFGPIFGKGEVKRNLPVILEFGRLSDLEFIKELAEDLRVRR